MFKWFLKSFFYSIGLVTTIFLILTLIFPAAAQIRILYLLVCICFPIHLFSFLTFELKLFSKSLWGRRAIIIIFSIFTMITVNYAFGYLAFELNSFFYTFVFSILGYIIFSVFAYYVWDKIEKRNLEIINQKLADKNPKNIE